MARHDRSPRGGVPQQTRKKQALSKQQRIIRQREREGRRVEALEAARAEQARLDARIAREAEQPVLGPVPGAAYKAPVVVEAPPPPPPPVYLTKGQWPKRMPGRWPLPAPDAEGSVPLGAARSMLRAGYHVARVQAATGWGIRAFDDMPLDELGYGLPLEEW